MAASESCGRFWRTCETDVVVMATEDKQLCSTGAVAGTLGRSQGSVGGGRRWQKDGSGQLAGMGWGALGSVQALLKRETTATLWFLCGEDCLEHSFQLTWACLT